MILRIIIILCGEIHACSGVRTTLSFRGTTATAVAVTSIIAHTAARIDAAATAATRTIAAHAGAARFGPGSATTNGTTAAHARTVGNLERAQG